MSKTLNLFIEKPCEFLITHKHLRIGRGSRNRTDDLTLPKRALYQAELYPDVNNTI